MGTNMGRYVKLSGGKGTCAILFNFVTGLYRTTKYNVGMKIAGETLNGNPFGHFVPASECENPEVKITVPNGILATFMKAYTHFKIKESLPVPEIVAQGLSAKLERVTRRATA